MVHRERLKDITTSPYLGREIILCIISSPIMGHMIISVAAEKYYHFTNLDHMIIPKNNARAGTRTKIPRTWI